MFATMKTLQVKVNLLKNKKDKQFNGIKHSRKNTEMKTLKGGNKAAENVQRKK